MIKALLAIDQNSILTAVLVAIIAILLVMLLIERSKRRSAQARASRISAEARKAPEEQPPQKPAGNLQTIRETDPRDIEFDSRIDPSPMGVIAKRDVDGSDTAPIVKPNKNGTDKYENRLTVEEDDSYAPPTSKFKKSDLLDEPISNAKIYSPDKLLIDENDTDEADVLIVPKKKKKEAKDKNKLLISKNSLLNNLVIEESYEPIIGDIALSEEKPSPEDAPRETVEEAAAPTEEMPKAPQDKPIISPFGAVTNALSGISSAFSEVANIAKPKKNTNPEEKAEKPTAADKKQPAVEKEQPVELLKSLREKAKQYADSEDMFEKAPYKLPINPEPCINISVPSLTVPSSLSVSMTERDENNPPMYINVGKAGSVDANTPVAEREGEVALNIFVNSDMESEIASNSETPSADAKVADFAMDNIPDAPLSPSETAENASLPRTDGALEEVIVVEENPGIQAPADEASYLINGEVVEVRYRSSFASRLIQAPSEVQAYYSAIKNEILAYNGIKVKNSWNYESFNRGTEQCVKLNIRGRSVMLHLALNPADYEGTKYRFKDMSGVPKFEKVPMLLSVRTERGLKYATELISQVMEKMGALRGEKPSVDYSVPYESNAELALRGLVKIILPDGVTVDKNSEIVSVNVDEFINGATPEK